MSSVNSYEGKVIDRRGELVITESNFRPAGMRFAACYQDGEPGVTARTMMELWLEIEERWGE